MRRPIDECRSAPLPFSLLRTKDEVADDHASVESAGVAFFGLLALFAAIATIILITGLIVDPIVVEQQVESFAASLPQNAAHILDNQARKVAAGAEATLGWAACASILFAIYGASKGIKTLMVGMNVAYDKDEDPDSSRSTRPPSSGRSCW